MYTPHLKGCKKRCEALYIYIYTHINTYTDGESPNIIIFGVGFVPHKTPQTAPRPSVRPVPAERGLRPLAPEHSLQAARLLQIQVPSGPPLRSNFNTRELNTREIGRSFGHNSLPRPS